MVRFSEANETFPHGFNPSSVPTLSRTASTSMSSPFVMTPPPLPSGSSNVGANMTPPPLDHLRSPYACTPLPIVEESIHTALRLPRYNFDLSVDPTSTLASSSSALTPEIRAEPATSPPLSSVVILSEFLPWKLTIDASSPGPNSFVTVWDVIVGLYRALRLRVRTAELSYVPAKHQPFISKAFEHRWARQRDPAVAREEQTNGIKRIDFLMENHRFIGLTAVSEGVLRLIVSR